jgi:hypothetical protein
MCGRSASMKICKNLKECGFKVLYINGCRWLGILCSVHAVDDH